MVACFLWEEEAAGSSPASLREGGDPRGRGGEKKIARAVMIVEVLYGVFGAGVLLSALAVTRAATPVNAALRLVLAFCNAAGRRRLLQVEFRALIFRVVYVGAVRVLFLFVVRRLNVQPLPRHERVRSGTWPRGLVVLGLFLGERWGVRSEVRAKEAVLPSARRTGAGSGGAGGERALGERARAGAAEAVRGSGAEGRSWAGEVVERVEPRTNLEARGQVLYTEYVVAFLRAGLVLLVARVGAIVLTRTVPSSSREQTLRQQVHQQVSRDVEQAILLTKPEAPRVG